jgi:hypothetical protein
VTAGRLLDTWVYGIAPGFTEAEVPGLLMPQGYKHSIATWYAALRCFGQV